MFKKCPFRLPFLEDRPRRLRADHDESNVAECVSARGPEDTFDGSVQDKSPCEVDINESLVDGRVEGRTEVHVESEVVLKCEGNNNEGACDIVCQM